MQRKTELVLFLGKTITKITKEIVVIQQAEFNAKALTDKQNGCKNWIDAKRGGLDNYLQELNTDLKNLKADKSSYIGLLENATEVSLGDLPAYAKYYYIQKYPEAELFNRGGSQSTTNLSDNFKKDIQDKCNNECVVCGERATAKPTVTHIIFNKELAEENGFQWDAANAFVLCGTDGEKNTCHHNFDNFRMGFQHVKDADNTQWIVVGSKWHGSRITIPTAPHKRILHSHLARGIANNSIDMENARDTWNYRDAADLSQSPNSHMAEDL